MDKAEETILGCVGSVAFIATIPLTVIARGWVLAKLWMWFVVPIGVVHIGIANAIGLSIVVGMFRAANQCQKEKNEDSAVVKGVKALAICGLELLIAYYFGMWVHSYM